MLNITTARHPIVRPAHIHTHTVKTPYSVRPVRTGAGWGPWLSRRMVIEWAPAFTYAFLARRTPPTPWALMSEDERWLTAVTRWVRLTSALSAAPDLADVPVPPTWAAGMTRCAAGGYVFDYRPTWRYCGRRVCVHCHARSVGAQYRHLVRAWNGRPKGVPVYLTRLTGLAECFHAGAAAVRAAGPAGAVLFRYPVRRKDGAVWWVYRAAVLTDTAAALRAAGRTAHRVHGVGRIATLLAGWFRYPRAWAQPPTLRSLGRAMALTARITARTKTFTAFGACRGDYVPGRGMMDWAAFAPGGPQRPPGWPADGRRPGGEIVDCG